MLVILVPVLPHAHTIHKSQNDHPRALISWARLSLALAAPMAAAAEEVAHIAAIAEKPGGLGWPAVGGWVVLSRHQVTIHSHKVPHL